MSEQRNIWREHLRRKAESRKICLGLGGEEAFVRMDEMIVSRDEVVSLLNEIDTLKQRLREATSWMHSASSSSKLVPPKWCNEYL